MRVLERECMAQRQQGKKSSSSAGRANSGSGKRSAATRTAAKPKGSTRRRSQGSRSRSQTSASTKPRQQPTYRLRSGTAAASAWTPPKALRVVIVVVVVVALVVGIAISTLSSAARQSQWEHDHLWQPTVEAAESYFGVDKRYTAAILTMIQVESDGNVDVDKYHDILQTFEGDGKKYLLKGVKSEGVKGKTPEASIYAGTYELSLCISDFEEYLGREPDPADPNDLALLAQGYNYGHLGWFSWLASEGIDTWTLEASETYQKRIDGLGTAIHGQKIMDTYQRIIGEDQ